MKPIFYEIRRTLSSKFVILMIVAIIGLSSLLAYESGAGFGSSSGVPKAPSVVGGYYISDGNLTVVTYSYNDHGQAYSGVDLNVTYNNIVKSRSSDKAGFANFTFQYDLNGSTLIDYNYTYKAFGLRQSSSSNGVITIIPHASYTGYVIAPGLVSKDNSSNLGFEVLYVGDNGSSSPLSTLYLAVNPGTPDVTPNEVYANETSSYNLTGLVTTSIFPSLNESQLNKTFDVAIMSQGKFLSLSPTMASAPSVGRLSIYAPMTQSALQSLVFSGIGTILGLLIPILGVFAGYLTYGKDKTTGVLESVMKRPVTRGGLITSRFVANSVSIIGSVIVSMIIGDVIIHHYFHLYLTTYFTLFYIWTYVVEGLAFLALIYMFSHLVKSQGALLGVTIAVFVVLGLFWSIIPSVIMLALGIGASSPLYLPLNIVFDFASPSGYSNLVSFFFTKSVGTLASVSANPATYGIMQATLLLSGFLWMAVPFVIAFFLARRSD